MSSSSLKGLSAITKGLSEKPSPIETENLSLLVQPDDPIHKIIMPPDPTRILIVPDQNKQPENSQRGPGRPPGRRSDPGYERLTVLVPKDTRKTAERTWEDTGGKDISQLVELLLRNYVAAPSVKPEV